MQWWLCYNLRSGSDAMCLHEVNNLCVCVCVKVERSESPLSCCLMKTLRKHGWWGTFLWSWLMRWCPLSLTRLPCSDRRYVNGVWALCSMSACFYWRAWMWCVKDYLMMKKCLRAKSRKSPPSLRPVSSRPTRLGTRLRAWRSGGEWSSSTSLGTPSTRSLTRRFWCGWWVFRTFSLTSCLECPKSTSRAWSSTRTCLLINLLCVITETGSRSRQESHRLYTDQP